MVKTVTFVIIQSEPLVMTSNDSYNKSMVDKDYGKRPTNVPAGWKEQKCYCFWDQKCQSNKTQEELKGVVVVVVKPMAVPALYAAAVVLVSGL